MVDKAEFFMVADEIVAEGLEPSQRAIRERLVRGGSFSEIGPLFVEWATVRGFRARPTKDDLPKPLKDKLGTLAAEIWCDGVRQGALVAQNERDRLTVERDRLRLALAETAGRADALEEMMGMRAPRNDGNDDEPVQPPGDGDAAQFWERVMQEIHELLGPRTLATRAIIAELPEGIVDEAGRRDGNWGPGRLTC